MVLCPKRKLIVLDPLNLQHVESKQNRELARVLDFCYLINIVSGFNLYFCQTSLEVKSLAVE